MSDYEFEYDAKTHLTNLRHYVGGCGSVDSYKETTAQFKYNDVIQLRDELNDCITLMQENEERIKEDNKNKLIKEKERLLIEVGLIQDKLNKGNY